MESDINSINELKNLGDEAFKNGEYAAAIENYKTALNISNSKDPYLLGGLYIGLANTYYNLQDKDNYIKYYELYLELFPEGQVAVFSRLAHAYYFIDTVKSIEYHNKGLSIQVNDYDATCKLFAMIKSSNYMQEEIRSEAEFEMNRLKSTVYSNIKKYYSKNTKKYKSNDEKLNIGYLSSDCHTHIMMNYILPIWKHHDKEHFNITIFDCSSHSDFTTDVIKNLGHNYVNCRNMNNSEIASIIFDNDIDILVDLGGFTHLKSIVNLYKPAPVIVSYLGYLSTMGMSEVDYILADRFMLPENYADFYTEKPLWLDFGYHVFEPATCLPLLSSAPFESNGYITFGSFNCTSKFSGTILYLWAKILQNIPNSKLLIYRTQMTKSTIKRLQNKFRELGIDDNRVIYNTTTENPHLLAYGLADIALDSYPFSGMSICKEAALMGVPTVTLLGEGMQSRGAGSVNNVIGLGAYNADCGQSYIEIATALAADKENLRTLRYNLRNMVLESSICTKHEEFTKDLENKYEKIWADYINNQAV